MEDKGVDEKVVNFEEYIGGIKDAEGVGVELIEGDPEKLGNLNKERRDRGYHTIHQLVFVKGIKTLRGFVGSVRWT